MAARPAWRGQIRLALVAIPVEIFPATKSGASIAFHQVHEPSGKRVKYEKVVPGIGPVNVDEIVKGFEVSNMSCSSPRRLRRSSWRAARRWS
jgi:DNA end-binding protein Ku